MPFYGLAQTFDSTYYHSYHREITARIFTSRKYTRLLLSEPGGTLKYRPNTPPNIGIGATYSFVTLNLAAGLGFLAPPNEKGRTRYLDLQTHFYFRRFSVDLLGQFYHGYYLPDAALRMDADYSRPDLRVAYGGAAGYYVFNFRRFSYRAAMVSDEWQLRSAGSFLAGWELYFGSIRADSALAPSFLSKDSSGYKTRSARFFEMGPGVGYAYTFVWRRHYFLTGGATVAGAYGTTHEYGNTAAQHEGFIPLVTYRLSAGYNGSLWGLHASWVNGQVALPGVYAAEAYRIKTGIYRLTVVRRFVLPARGKSVRYRALFFPTKSTTR
ncbi:DUF4421 domain-containing protein [Dinghuibacter silviterrae]|uniref:Uncharacterized protein DUF4421 n=1 Tax=Dinghuibacter silviterrae TaxID=1539049 RepID=A0A4R8DRW9_9BACT|nr:DUF4421 domain-containing protein [Dinghuibacter silviterrae]TDX00558.1 uncharacterized protein DUF4421 [Dinghuibacter silviterrae]